MDVNHTLLDALRQPLMDVRFLYPMGTALMAPQMCHEPLFLCSLPKSWEFGWAWFKAEVKGPTKITQLIRTREGMLEPRFTPKSSDTEATSLGHFALPLGVGPLLTGCACVCEARKGVKKLLRKYLEDSS